MEIFSTNLKNAQFFWKNGKTLVYNAGKNIIAFMDHKERATQTLCLLYSWTSGPTMQDNPALSQLLL